MAQAAQQTMKERYYCMNPSFHAQDIFSWYSNFLQANEYVIVEDSFDVAFNLKGIPVTDKFVGRNTELRRLAQLMISSTNNMHRKVCLLHGIGGVGKSQLAAEFARKHQENFSAIFWIAGNSKERLKRSIAALAQRLPSHQIPAKMVISLSKDATPDLDTIAKDVLKWFSKRSNNKWLLIFDNVDREYSAQPEDPEAFTIKECLPEADQGSILITSRLSNMWRLAGSSIKLEPFDELQGEFLLNSIVEIPLVGRLKQTVTSQRASVLIRFVRFIRACEFAWRSSISN